MVKVKAVISIVMVVAVIAVLSSISIACGNQKAEVQQTQKSDEVVDEITSAAQTAETQTVQGTVAQASGECPAATSVNVESTNGAYKDRMPISWDKIGSQSAYITNSTNNTGVFIYIANFETSENLKDVSLSDGQALIQFTLTVKGQGDPVPISVGKYNVREWVDNYVSTGIRLTGGTTVTVSSADTTNGDFEITSVTDTEICGKFNIDEKWTKMTGEFKVPIVK